MSARLRNADFIDRFIDVERKVRRFGLVSPWVDLSGELGTNWFSGTDPAFYPFSARERYGIVDLRGLVWASGGTPSANLVLDSSVLAEFAPSKLCNIWVPADPDNTSGTGNHHGYVMEVGPAVAGVSSIIVDQNLTAPLAPQDGAYFSFDGVSYSL